MFANGEVVELTAPMSAYGLREGDRGTVVRLHRDYRTYVVAFVRDDRMIKEYDVPYSLLRRAERDLLKRE